MSPEAESDLDFALSIDTLSNLFNAASLLFGEPFIGAKVTLSLQRGRFGLIGYATFNAPTLGHSLQLLVRYSMLLNRAVQYELLVEPTGGRIRQRVSGRADGLGRHGNEFNVVAMIQMSRAILNQLFRSAASSTSGPSGAS